MGVIEERIDRAISFDYEFLEKPEALDMMERGAQATGGNMNGVEGMMHIMASLGASFVTVIVTLVSVTVLDFRLIFVLTVFVVMQYLYYTFCVKRSKKKVWDELGNTWCEIEYMESVTQDFDYAKDIRFFHYRISFLASRRRFLIIESGNMILTIISGGHIRWYLTFSLLQIYGGVTRSRIY